MGLGAVGKQPTDGLSPNPEGYVCAGPIGPVPYLMMGGAGCFAQHVRADEGTADDIAGHEDDAADMRDPEFRAVAEVGVIN